MTRLEHWFVMLLFVLPLCACGSPESTGCPLPPKGFSQSDLIGTWDAIDAKGRQEDNTIIIRGDGRYKQIMNVSWEGFNYEGDWKPWRVTYSEKGLPYLHLEGLLMCAYWSQMDCRTEQTGITPIVPGDTKDPFTGEYYWHNFCENTWVNTPGEGVFMVFGGGTSSSRGIRLVPFTKSSDGTTGPDYDLREQ